MKSSKNVKTAIEETAAVEKEPVKKTTAKGTAAKKTVKKAEAPAEKASEKPAEEPKKAARKTPGRKPAVKESVSLQYMGKDIQVAEIVSQVKEIWTAQLGKAERDMKSINVYLKPEENKAYYVVNEDVTGSVDL